MRYLLGFLVAIGLVVVAFILIFTSFNRSTTTTTTKPLIDYANTNAVVQMTIDGPVTADQTHYEVQINVSDSVSQINVLNGYQGTVVNSQTYANNSASYAEFLRALDLAGYSKGETGSNVSSDPRGYCATGERYTFQITNGTHTIENFWATSCGGEGTFKGNTAVVKELFIAQIPNYETVTENDNNVN